MFDQLAVVRSARIDELAPAAAWTGLYDGLHICQDPHMIFGVSPTKDAIVVAQTRGSGETFAITSIMSIRFQARCGDDLADLRRRLRSLFDRAGKRRRSTVALLGSSSGRFKSSVEAIKAEAVTGLFCYLCTVCTCACRR